MSASLFPFEQPTCASTYFIFKQLERIYPAHIVKTNLFLGQRSSVHACLLTFSEIHLTQSILINSALYKFKRSWKKTQQKPEIAFFNWKDIVTLSGVLYGICVLSISTAHICLDLRAVETCAAVGFVAIVINVRTPNTFCWAECVDPFTRLRLCVRNAYT